MTPRDELAKIIADHGPPEYLNNRHELWKWIEDNDEAVLALIDAVYRPWECDKECLAFMGYGHHRKCKNRLAHAQKRLWGDDE